MNDQALKAFMKNGELQLTKPLALALQYRAGFYFLNANTDN